MGRETCERPGTDGQDLSVNDRFEARKAIESLRAGVPNLAAVSALGANLETIANAFERNCVSAIGRVSTEAIPRGFLIEGNFGSGKSHALRYLQTIAASKKMAFSTVAISKETPLGDLTAVFRTAVATLNFGDRKLTGTLAGVFEELVRNEKTFDALCKKVSNPTYALDSQFLAALQLLQRYRAAPEIMEQLFDFFDGGPAQIAQWKQWLREIDQSHLSLKAMRANDLAPQRFRFVALVLAAAGFEGWFIALDEVELIASFGQKGRFKAYENLAFLFEPPADNESMRRWFVVGAITEDLGLALFDKRHDDIAIVEKFGLDSELRANGTLGIGILREVGRTHRLREPTDSVLREAHDRIRELYARAYDVRVDAVFDSDAIRARSKSMRSYVREWIAYWDLKMQDRAYQPVIETREVAFSLEEDADLEAV